MAADTQDDWERLCGGLELPSLAGDARFRERVGRRQNDEALANVLAGIFGGRTASEWLARLRGAGVPCAEVTEGYNIGYFEDEHIAANGMFREYEHRVYGRMRYAADGLRFGDTRAVLGRRTPLLGEHNDEALAALGYGAAEIAGLYESGVLTIEEPPEG